MDELLFVYGTLSSAVVDRRLHELVAQFRNGRMASVRGRLYDLGEYPGMVLDDAAGEVAGQVVELPEEPEFLRRLDTYEGYDASDPAGSLFRRVRCRVSIESGQQVDCWVYVYNQSVTGRRLSQSGRWKT